jgi:hypothetical protein
MVITEPNSNEGLIELYAFIAEDEDVISNNSIVKGLLMDNKIVFLLCYLFFDKCISILANKQIVFTN